MKSTYLVFLVTLVIPCVGVMATEPDGWTAPGRRAIANAALRSLPAKESERLPAAARSAMEATLDLPFQTGAQDPLFQKYVRLPGPNLDYDTIAGVFEFYVSNLARELKNSNGEEVGRYLGACVSVLADRVAPVKCLDGKGGEAYRSFAQLFPAPPGAPYDNAVSVMALGRESVKPDLSGYTPRLLGTSPQESAFHARNSFVHITENAYYRLSDLVKARYQQNTGQADTLLNEMAAGPARLIADILHTACAMADNQYSPEELGALRTVDLTHIPWLTKPGYAGGPYRGRAIVYGASLANPTKKVPLQLSRIENGTEKLKTFERGMGVGGHSKWAFGMKIPPAVFGKLDIYLGMHATLGNAASYGKKYGEMQLQITLNDAVLFDSGVLTPGKPATYAIVDVTPGGLLQLKMFDHSGQWGNYGNQVVFGEPTLIRAEKAPQGL